MRTPEQKRQDIFKIRRIIANFSSMPFKKIGIISEYLMYKRAVINKKNHADQEDVKRRFRKIRRTAFKNLNRIYPEDYITDAMIAEEIYNIANKYFKTNKIQVEKDKIIYTLDEEVNKNK